MEIQSFKLLSISYPNLLFQCYIPYIYEEHIPLTRTRYVCNTSTRNSVQNFVNNIRIHTFLFSNFLSATTI